MDFDLDLHLQVESFNNMLRSSARQDSWGIGAEASAVAPAINRMCLSSAILSYLTYILLNVFICPHSCCISVISSMKVKILLAFQVQVQIIYW